MKSDFFIDRPIFSIVISIVIVIVGVLGLFLLPIDQYPQIVPPVVKVSASYPGASAQTVTQAVATPIEQELNGTPGMLYMESSSSNSGGLSITVTFDISTDAELAAVDIQNRVKLAESRLPAEVIQNGISVEKQAPSQLMTLCLTSTDPKFDEIYLSNFATINVLDVIRRIPGVGRVSNIGSRYYAMQIWAQPDKLANFGLTVQDLQNALKDQNRESAAGVLGQQPVEGLDITIPITTQGRLSTVGQFEDIVVRANANGSIIRLKDVARVSLEASSYNTESGINGENAAVLGIYMLPGANAMEVAERVKEAMDEISENFPEGLQAEYFDNTRLEGTPKVRKENWINFEPANQAPDPFLPKSPLSVRWTGKLKPTISGRYTFSFTSDDGCRLSIDNQMLIDAWQAHAVSTDSASIYLEAGKEYQLKAEYYDNRDYAIAKLQWKVPQIGKATRLDLYGEAGKAVRECETVIAVMGINKSIEREGQDRYDIQLPADQREFLQEIYKVNSNMIVILVAGSSLAINWMDEHVPAIVNAWYPGEQGGTAIAEVLFGDYNPAGRLPLTFYNSIEDLPAFDDYNVKNNRTYMYFEGKPLYAFGYGLSYTKFDYRNLNIKQDTQNVTLNFSIKNSGKYNGDEVAQVYVKFPDQGIKTPLKQLKGFKRVHIKKGATEQISIEIPKEELRLWDDQKKQFYTPSGTYHFMVGKSSDNICLQKTAEL